MILYDPRYNIKRKMTGVELAEMSGRDECYISRKKRTGKKFLDIYYLLDDDTPLAVFKELYSKEEYENEIWTPLKERSDKYIISNYGRIKCYHPVGKFYTFSMPYRKSLVHSGATNGKVFERKWLINKLMLKDKYSEVVNHGLVASNFLEIPTGIKDPVVHHINGILFDNRVENLEYIERSFLGRKSGAMSNGRPIRCLDTHTGEITFYNSGREAARNFPISYQAVFDNANGKTKLAGYRYKFYWDDLEER